MQWDRNKPVWASSVTALRFGLIQRKFQNSTPLSFWVLHFCGGYCCTLRRGRGDVWSPLPTLECNDALLRLYDYIDRVEEEFLQVRFELVIVRCEHLDLALIIVILLWQINVDKVSYVCYN